MDSIVLIVIVIVIALLLILAVAGFMLARRRQSEKLQKHFGTEYERTVTDTGDRKAAESQLRDRERRHRDLDIRSLRPDERDGFRREWESVQQSFVDDPPRALQRADELVVEIMRTRGYPVDDFDRRADDISVAHPDVVHHYREARGVRDADGSVDTEKQRHALTSYRSLVEALLGRTEQDGRHRDDQPADARPADAQREDAQREGDHDDPRTDRSGNGHVDGAANGRPGVQHAERSRRTEEQTR